MATIRRPLRVLLLAWAVLLAPHAALLHALSHDLAAGAGANLSGDKRHAGAHKVCDGCLAFAKTAAAPPRVWIAVVQRFDAPAPSAKSAVAGSVVFDAPFDARAPPATRV